MQDMTALHLACKQGHLDCVKLLIQGKADINARGGSTKQTPLLVSLEFQHKEIAVHLIKSKADITKRDSEQTLPLHMAALACLTDVVEMLVEAVGQKKRSHIVSILHCEMFMLLF
jgi:ankyrin repeat protein